MERTGWAAAVGSLYRTRNGHIVRIFEYRVTWDGPDATPSDSTVAGIVRDDPNDFRDLSMRFFYGPDGCCRTIVGKTDASPEYRADFDLIEAVQPAQITKSIKCKDDLATRPQEGTETATVVPRKDLP